MKNDIEVRDIEELKDNFSLAQVLFYLANGKLDTWLRDRRLDDIADAISKLNQEDAEFNKKVCDIFEVECVEECGVSIKKVKEKQRKIELLQTFTDGESFIEVIEKIAFEQNDVYDLLNKGENVIYLCGDKFTIPLNNKSISYIGINNPLIAIFPEDGMESKEVDINFENIRLDEESQKVLDDLKNREKEEYNNYDIKNREYSTNSSLHSVLSQDDAESAEECYNKISVLLETIKYDIDDDIRDIREKILSCGLIGMGISYLDNL